MPYPQTLGVFSKRPPAKTGTGGTTSDKASATYWYVRRIDDNVYEVQPLNSNNIPAGLRTHLSKGDFIRQFTPEPGFYEQRTLPLLRSLQKKLELGARYLDERLLGPAEREFMKAAMIDEENVEANLGLGTIYCEQGKTQKLTKVLRILMNNDDTFREEQRHLFNTFGMSLRKQGLADEAVAYYARALAMNEHDENLHFNIARAFHQRGQAGDRTLCIRHLRHALELNPGFDEAQRFLDFCENQS
ncbi:tetratricopeptide (TPR) repeat protein [Desulfobaculum xiamenense]|uniref:Tetratricopeptide (TPR) repeat protein n=1 Tax=Desulfobaculum xiamenense TaxID=995050 RepID=A0A846QW63_9BACT|nr:hypothetical protein [Desulfobaculum xiamenense]NJB68869.1 tetratricopeptide (TPR) repeat protein [Desulfobaculum xiamenense]